MKFVDRTKIVVRGGNGGRGVVSFRGPKRNPCGGPDGGDGGNGGDVVLVATTSLDSLEPFFYQPEWRAEAGVNGARQMKKGRDGRALVVEVPVGTMVRGGDGQPIVDLNQHGQRFVVAKGGRGGRGNYFFVSSTNRSPRGTRSPGPGERIELFFDLTLVIDVALIGPTKGGKSTLLNRLTRAHAKVADYPYTTDQPVLGVIPANENFASAITIAELPSIHPSRDRNRFLHHSSRASHIIMVLDASRDPKQLIADFHRCFSELRLHQPKTETPVLMVLNKHDCCSLTRAQCRRQFSRHTKIPASSIFVMSGRQDTDLDDLLAALRAPLVKPAAPEVLQENNPLNWFEARMQPISP